MPVVPYAVVHVEACGASGGDCDVPERRAIQNTLRLFSDKAGGGTVEGGIGVAGFVR